MVRKITTKEKVLVHLLDYYSTREKYQQPVEITQEGMAEVIGSKQNTISYSVRSLVNEGLLHEDTSRIKGKKQRRKGYFLTDRGVKKAKKIHSKVSQTPISAVIGGDEREVLLKDINKFFHTNFSPLEILNRVEDGVFTYESSRGEKEQANYLFNMPEPPAKRHGSIDELSKKFQDGGSIFLVEGEPGTGRTSLLTSFVEEQMNETPIFYFKIEDWHNERYMLDHLAAFFSKNGEHKLSSYLESARDLKIAEAMANLKRDLTRISEAIIIMDDIDENPILMRILCNFAKEVRDIDQLGMIFSSRPGRCPPEQRKKISPERILIDSEECERTMFVELAEFYGIKETCEAVLDLVLENNLTPEEHLALSYMSVHRYPVERNEICKLDTVNNNLIINLLKTPMAMVSVEEKPIIHPQVRERLMGRLPLDTKKILNSIAADYYDEIPAKTTWEKIEMLYHLAGADEREDFFRYLKEYGFDIISNGYSRSVLEITEHLETVSGDMTGYPTLSFWRAECHRLLSEYPLALREYRNVIDSSEDDELVTLSHHGVARILEEQGRYESALLEYEKSIDRYQRSSVLDSKLTGKTLFQVANVYSKRNEFDRARDYLASAVEILEDNKNYPTLTSAYFLLARVEKESGNSFEAIEAFERGMAAWEKIEETYHRVGGLHDIGAFYKVIRDLSNAKDFLKETIDMCEQMGYSKLKASALLTLTECHLEKGEYESAAGCAEEATRIFNELNYEEERAYGHALLGQVYSRLNDMDKAEDNLAKAISIYQKLGSSYPLGLAYFSMAKLQEKKGNKEGIASNFRKSLLLLSSSGASRMIEHVQREMKTIPLSM